MFVTVKRILYVGGFELPDKNAAAQRVLGIAKALRVLGYEVVFLDVDKTVQGNGLSEVHTTEGFPTYSQRHAADMKGLIRYAGYPLHAEEILDKWDDWHGVIAYNYPAFALSRLNRICKKRNIRLYADCTEWYSYEGFSPKKLLIQADSFLRMRFVQKRLDGMIAISRYLERYYRKHLKTVVLPPMIDSDDPKWRRTERERHSARLQLVYAGSTGAHKDRLNVMVRAIPGISEQVCLSVVGITAEKYLQLYPNDRALIAELTETGALCFRGRLSHREAIEAVKNADLTLFFRQKSRLTSAGFPTKFVESVSCGTPVVTTDTSDLKDYSKDGKNAALLSVNCFEEELGAFLEAFAKSEKRIPVEPQTFDYRRFVPALQDFFRE